MKSQIIRSFKSVITILLIPIKFLLNPIFRFIFRDEINYEKDKYKNLCKKHRELNDNYSLATKSNKQLSKKLRRIESIFKSNNGSKFEVTTTKTHEMVFIFSRKENKEKLTDYYLCGIDGSNTYNDCKIELTHNDDNLKINDFVSTTQNRGYGRALLEFTLKKAKDLKIKKIHGDLSHVDSADFDWLLPFYESFGFHCTLFNDKSKYWDGKIELIFK